MLLSCLHLLREARIYINILCWRMDDVAINYWLRLMMLLPGGNAGKSNKNYILVWNAVVQLCFTVIHVLLLGLLFNVRLNFGQAKRIIFAKRSKCFFLFFQMIIRLQLAAVLTNFIPSKTIWNYLTSTSQDALHVIETLWPPFVRWRAVPIRVFSLKLCITKLEV